MKNVINFKEHILFNPIEPKCFHFTCNRCKKKINERVHIHLFHTKTSQSGVYCTITAHLNLDWLHFKSFVASYGKWLRLYDTTPEQEVSGYTLRKYSGQQDDICWPRYELCFESLLKKNFFTRAFGFQCHWCWTHHHFCLLIFPLSVYRVLMCLLTSCSQVCSLRTNGNRLWNSCV